MSHPVQRPRWPMLLTLWAVFGLFVPIQGAGAADPYFSAPIDFDLEAAETDPYGNPAVPTSTLSLTDDEVAKVRAGGYKSANLWAGAGEWYNAIDAGATARFEELGIEVIARTDAQFDPAIQANDVETSLAAEPDIILSEANYLQQTDWTVFFWICPARITENVSGSRMGTEAPICDVFAGRAGGDRQECRRTRICRIGAEGRWR